MRLNLIIWTMALMFSLPAAQATAEGLYFKAQGAGVLLLDPDITGEFNTVSLDMDSGYGAGGAIGFHVPRGRLEIEATYRENDVKEIELVGMTFEPGGTVSSWSGMFNSYAEYPLDRRFTAYVMAGVGAAEVSIEEELTLLGFAIEDSEDVVFAYQGGAGVEYRFLGPLRLSLEYRYFATLAPEFSTEKGPAEMEYKAHNLIAGLQLSF